MKVVEEEGQQKSVSYEWTAAEFDPEDKTRVKAEISLYEKLGNIVGLAIYTGTFVNFSLPKFFYKLKCKGIESLTLDDFAEWQPDKAKSLQYILDYDKHDECSLEDLLCRTFTTDITYQGQHKTIELKPNGDEIYVTKENREEFVKLAIEFEVQTQAKECID